MKKTFLQIAFALAIALALAMHPVRVSTQNATDLEAKVDGVFGKWTLSSPGCAVAVSVNGKQALGKAYGLADLEHDVKNIAETIFEAGSVSKQFTAAAVRAGLAILVPMSASRFVTVNGQTWEIARGAARQTDQFGTVETYERVMPAKPTVEQLKELIGTYTSDDAETTLTATIIGEALVLKRRPETTIRLTPIYPDAFNGSLGTVVFRRDATGRVTEFSVAQDRVWDLRFKKQTVQGQ